MKKLKHKKRGSTYSILYKGRVQTDVPLEDMTELVTYIGEAGDIWHRTESELFDGRFEVIENDGTHSINILSSAILNEDGKTISIKNDAELRPGDQLVLKKDADTCIMNLLSIIESLTKMRDELENKISK